MALLYRTGDFEAAFGRPLAAAGGRLARLPGGPAAPAGAGRRGARPLRPPRPSSPSPAPARWRRSRRVPTPTPATAGSRWPAMGCAGSRPLTGRAGPLKAAGDLLARSGAFDEAEAAYLDAGRVAGDADPALSAALRSARADLAWRRDQPAAAAAGWLAALAAGGERHERRLLEAKLAALGEAGLATALRPWLLGQADPATALADLERLGRPLGDYLAARARLARGEVKEALLLLERSGAGPAPGADRAGGGATCWPRPAASPARRPPGARELTALRAGRRGRRRPGPRRGGRAAVRLRGRAPVARPCGAGAWSRPRPATSGAGAGTRIVRPPWWRGPKAARSSTRAARRTAGSGRPSRPWARSWR